jgi:hypothetical protein
MLVAKSVTLSVLTYSFDQIPSKGNELEKVFYEVRGGLAASLASAP